MIDLKIDIPEKFFEEEELSGHLVSREMKEVWAVELDLLAELNRVCKKYNIRYFADAGTMLGAIRHSGFIPWDDDIDVTLSRSDYERLCEVASKEFTGNYFWQTEYTDRGTLRGHAQLRNSATTGILKNELGKKDFNQGIFIDIFPFDSVSDNPELFKKQKKDAERLKRQYKRIAHYTDYYKTENSSFFKRLLAPFIRAYIKLTNLDYDVVYRQFEEVCARYNDQYTEKISLLSFDFDTVHFQTRSDFEDVEYVPFEFVEIPVPKGYHHALTERFGDYNVFVRNGSYHGGVLFDTNIPYTEYLKKYNKK